MLSNILHIQRRVLKLDPKLLRSYKYLPSNESRLIRADEHLLMTIVLEFFLTENSSFLGKKNSQNDFPSLVEIVLIARLLFRFRIIVNI